MSGLSAPIETPDGVFLATFSEHGLRSLRFPDGSSSGPTPAEVSPWLEVTAGAVRAILAGKRPGAFPPIDLEGESEFRRLVWAELQKIPLGATVTYAELAERLGRKNGARAVGGACGANPIPVLIPCHRVLAQGPRGQRLGGFSGGLDWKIRLLQREGVLL